MNQIKVIGIDYGVDKKRHPNADKSIEERIVEDILTSVARTYDTECPEYCFYNDDIIVFSNEVLLQEEQSVDIVKIREILKTKTKKDITIQRWGIEDHMEPCLYSAYGSPIYNFGRIRNIVGGCIDENNRAVLIQNLITD